MLGVGGVIRRVSGVVGVSLPLDVNIVIYVLMTTLYRYFVSVGVSNFACVWLCSSGSIVI